uniref:MYND-type domain-containing protein n=1 Tax=Chromera velia CCMP2878 TaxID=1169474 RepID=A0A0G4HIM3_9ALVE|eukprot:Cvel_7032.t1-p1 / transcript=Cvel_7032.t1 / gene=Cvel_7032 / organism=Chromera_velia_CCMP2878 / gene_product=hypothetical protein / transcript_product=hypothetical protein / location=Cvel_scaffold358:93513-94529(+) / protein_length=339 / sequence_SO=supercontig / SO=protein_coding / is_pseudo=false
MKTVRKWVEGKFPTNSGGNEGRVDFSTFPEQHFLKTVYHAFQEDYATHCYDIGVHQWARWVFEKISSEEEIVQERGEGRGGLGRVRICQLCLTTLLRLRLPAGSKMSQEEKEKQVLFFADIVKRSQCKEFVCSALDGLVYAGPQMVKRLFTEMGFTEVVPRLCGPETVKEPNPFFDAAKDRYETLDLSIAVVNRTASFVKALGVASSMDLIESMNILPTMVESRKVLEAMPYGPGELIMLKRFFRALPADVQTRYGITEIARNAFDKALDKSVRKSDKANQEVRDNVLRCAVCKVAGSLQDGVRISPCSRCRAVHYCSKECQKKDWKAQHKQKCVPAED